MNSIAKWILESVAATVVISICFVVSEVLFPSAVAVALSGFPIVLYLSWRLHRETFAWSRAVVLAAILASLLLVQQLVLPQSWQPWSRFVIVFIGAWAWSYLLRRQKETHRPCHTTPG